MGAISNVVTSFCYLYKTISNINITFSNCLQTRYKFAFAPWMILVGKVTISANPISKDFRSGTLYCYYRTRFIYFFLNLKQFILFLHLLMYCNISQIWLYWLHWLCLKQHFTLWLQWCTILSLSSLFSAVVDLFRSGGVYGLTSFLFLHFLSHTNNSVDTLSLVLTTYQGPTHWCFTVIVFSFTKHGDHSSTSSIKHGFVRF